MSLPNTSRRPAAALLLTLAMVAGCSEQPAPAGLSAANGWARAVPPGKTVTAGFAEIANRGASDCRIDSLASGQAERVELHTTSMDGGVMRMRPIAEPTIGAGEVLRLAPGGDHLMFIGLGEHAGHGDALDVTLVTSCGELELLLPFGRGAPAGDHSHH